LNALIEKQNALPNHRQRWCTRMLKIEPYRKWMETQADYRNVVSYVGLRYDEPGRAGGYYDDIDGVSTRYPLREWKWTVSDVWKFLDDRGIEIPRRTDCARCYHQQLVEWWILFYRVPRYLCRSDGPRRNDRQDIQIAGTRYVATIPERISRSIPNEGRTGAEH
jgi:3'-phosphoadenosine 5'-phosphosulfate sulfotransferase (PAPS reductase)/FAD synthetase